MTPRAKTDLEIAGVVITIFIALGGLYAYGSSREAKIEVLKSRVDKIDTELAEIKQEARHPDPEEMTWRSHPA